jgi:hypothetical protein
MMIEMHDLTASLVFQRMWIEVLELRSTTRLFHKLEESRLNAFDILPSFEVEALRIYGIA